jgi:hypothetical protein
MTRRNAAVPQPMPLLPRRLDLERFGERLLAGADGRCAASLGPTA